MRWGMAVALAMLATACRTTPAETANAMVARFYLEQDDAQSVVVRLPVSGVRLAVAPKPVLTEFDVADVDVARAELGQCLRFRFTPAAERDLSRLMAVSRGRRLVLLLDGQPMGARRIEGANEDGTLAMFVELPDARLPRVTRSLQQEVAEIRGGKAKQ